MAHRESLPVDISVEIDGADNLAKRMSNSLQTLGSVQATLRKFGKIIQARAVANASGRVVSYRGTTWALFRRTGKLVRSIQVAGIDTYSVTVEATAEYAGDVEQGTRGPVDLKRTQLSGKVVPLPVSKAQTKALTAKNGRLIQTIFVGRFNSKQTSTSGFRVNNKVATTGRPQGATGILFRRVPGPNGKGWIIPQRKPRPFLQEAGDYAAPLFAAELETKFAQFLAGEET